MRSLRIMLVLAVAFMAGCKKAQEYELETRHNGVIGAATMEDDGTIVLQLRTELILGDERGVAEGTFRYPPDHAEYDRILRHLGGLKRGESKFVPPWPEEESTENPPN